MELLIPFFYSIGNPDGWLISLIPAKFTRQCDLEGVLRLAAAQYVLRAEIKNLCI